MTIILLYLWVVTAHNSDGAFYFAGLDSIDQWRQAPAERSNYCFNRKSRHVFDRCGRNVYFVLIPAAKVIHGFLYYAECLFFGIHRSKFDMFHKREFGLV